MCYKKFWNNLGIKNKLFIISTTIVFITSIIIYISLYLLFPKLYLNIKEGSINSATTKMINKLEKEEDADYVDILNDYSFENGAMVFLVDEFKNIMYSSNRYMTKQPFIKDVKDSPLDRRVKEELTLEQSFYLKSSNKNVTLKAIVPLKFVTEAKEVMTTIIPIILIITIFIGILSAYIYSQTISKPLLNINFVANKISKLDFSQKLNYGGNDEFAQLSNSINSISENLEKTILDLEDANKSLLSDIEKERLQDKQRRDFLKAISHELKTPITIINGQIEGMIYKIGPYKNRDKYLVETLEKIKELSSLAEEIINITKYEEGLKLNYTNFNINELLHDIVENYSFLIEVKNLTINFLEKHNLIIIGDIEILKKVLSNLINNAIKYSFDNSAIELCVESSKIYIKNKTTKIDTDIDRLFEAFYRVDKSRSRALGGSGLGLYIVKTLLNIHNNIDYNIKIEDDNFIFIMDFKETLSKN